MSGFTCMSEGECAFMKVGQRSTLTCITRQCFQLCVCAFEPLEPEIFHYSAAGDEERLQTGDKNNNSAIFVVYLSEIEFVHQARSPAVSQRVTSFQLRRCFNLRTRANPSHRGRPRNGCSEAIKLSRPITNPLCLTRALIFSGRQLFVDLFNTPAIRPHQRLS